MHDDIRGFHLKGELADEADILVEKQKLVSEIEVMMRDNGFIPVLDLDPQFGRYYDTEADKFKFRATVYGVKDKDAWSNTGMSSGKVMTSTTLTRSNLSLLI